MERKQKILQLLSEKETVNVDELTSLFHVSKVTVRNDLDELDGKGLLVRLHGGAMTAEKKDFVRLISNTMLESTEEKERIAKCASQLIHAGQSIIIDNGSTTVHLAKYLSGKQLTVATGSLLMMEQLMHDESVELVVIGGTLRRYSMGAIGSMARSCYAQFHADLLFLGASGYTLKDGVTCTNLVEADTKQAMILSANKVCLLVDSAKMGKLSFATVCDWDDIDYLVTDGIDDATKAALQEKGVEVLVAS
jgi:DeoR family fructose operon transcriptional repressor